MNQVTKSLLSALDRPSGRAHTGHMRNRYKVTGPWSGESKFGDFYTQHAQITDQLNGHVYEEGAFRVVDAAHDMKPAKTGKGGTVPFFGEMAWAEANRLAQDLWTARQYGR